VIVWVIFIGLLASIPISWLVRVRIQVTPEVISMFDIASPRRDVPRSDTELSLEHGTLLLRTKSGTRPVNLRPVWSKAQQRELSYLLAAPIVDRRHRFRRGAANER
jgi:hypothetical protein